MAIIDAIVNFRRFLKRRNHSPHTVRNYLNRLKHFVVWLDVPLEKVTPVNVLFQNGVNGFAGGGQFIRVVGFAEYPVMGG